VRLILKDIVDENKRAGELIRRLRILFKKGEIQMQPIDANELVRDVLKLMRGDLINRRMAASSELAPQLPEVSGDRVQLQQVLLNLLINAADATPEGASEIHPLVVRTAMVDNGSVCISVRDHGRGIPPADLQLVFEPFMTTKAHGMGLGLTVCRTIMEAHHGRIWAENNPGAGTTFHLSLPTARSPRP
jgi:signal transduction histidine kinase